MNKKGVFGISLFFAILLIIIIVSIVAYFISFKPSPVNYIYKSANEKAVTQSFMLAYLRTPVENSNVATIIAQWTRSSDQQQQLFESKIMESTNQIISNFHKQNLCWTLTAGERKISNDNCEDSKKPTTSSLTIPLSSGEPIKVTLTK